MFSVRRTTALCAALVVSLCFSSALAGPVAPTERVTGIGGFFFRAHDPAALARWYWTHLGVTEVPTSYGAPAWQQQAGTTVFTPFSETNDYFDTSKGWMLNFRVSDLDRMAAQLEKLGTKVTIDPKTYSNGRFAHLADPEGNPIELWEPK
jgi:predicted enzyme related to lactoylglutathione lyase